MGTKALAILDLASGIMDDEGNPLASGRVYFYDAGTLNDKEVYLDRNKTTPASQPVELDIYGRAEIYGDGLYKMVIKDSDDVTLWDLDNVELVPLEGGTYDDVTINPTNPQPVTGSLLKFTVSLEDSNGDTITEFSEIANYIPSSYWESTFDDEVDLDSAVSSKDPIYWDSSSSTWKQADLTSNDPEAFCVTANDDGDGTYSGKIVYKGIASGVSGLSNGTKYYLDITGGLIASETVWYVGKALSTTSILIDFRKTTAGSGSGSVNLASLLAVISEARKRGGRIDIPYVNWLLEAAEELRVTIPLHTSYTGGTTTLKLTQKIFIEDGNYVPIYITDDTTGNYDEIWLDSLTGETAGEYTYSLVSSISNSYTTGNSAYVTPTTGVFEYNRIEKNGDSTGDVAQNAETNIFRYVRKEQVGTASLEAYKQFKNLRFPADLTNYAASQEVSFDDGGTDVSGWFKNDNYFALVKILADDSDTSEVVYPYKELQQCRESQDRSWYIFQMDSNATYSSPDVTASIDKVLDLNTGTFSTSLPTISDTDNWYVVRIPGFLKYIADSKTSTTWVEVYPTDFLAVPGTTIPAAATAAWLLQNEEVRDYTNNGYDLVKNGSPTKSIINGVIARGGFDDSNYYEYSTFAGNNPLHLDSGSGAKKGTLICYATFAPVTDYQIYCSVGQQSALAGDQPTMGYLNNDNFCFGLQYSNSTYYTYILAANMAAYEDGDLHLAVGVIDDNDPTYRLRFYMDGENKSNNLSSAMILSANTVKSRIGVSASATGDYCRNEIAGVLWLRNYTMSADEIAKFYLEVKTYGWDLASYLMYSKVENLSNIEKFGLKDIDSIESTDDGSETVVFGGGLIE